MGSSPLFSTKTKRVIHRMALFVLRIDNGRGLEGRALENSPVGCFPAPLLRPQAGEPPLLHQWGNGKAIPPSSFLADFASAFFALRAKNENVALPQLRPKKGGGEQRIQFEPPLFCQKTKDHSQGRAQLAEKSQNICLTCVKFDLQKTNNKPRQTSNLQSVGIRYILIDKLAFVEL